MYLLEPFFKLTALENDIGQQSRLLNAVIDQWRYNGQIIGREIPLYLTEEDPGDFTGERANGQFRPRNSALFDGGRQRTRFCDARYLP